MVRKSTVNATVTANAKPAFTEAEYAEAQREFAHSGESLWESLRGYEVPAGAKTLMMLIGRVALYAVGFVTALSITGALSAVLVTWGWPVFIIMCIEFMTLILGILAAWVVTDYAVDYIATGGVSRDIKLAGSWIKSKFNSTSGYVKGRMAN